MLDTDALPLALFMLCCLADHSYDPAPLDDFALVADLPYGCFYFHRSFLSKKIILP
jgi:hypothetical protein